MSSSLEESDFSRGKIALNVAMNAGIVAAVGGGIGVIETLATGVVTPILFLLGVAFRDERVMVSAAEDWFTGFLLARPIRRGATIGCSAGLMYGVARHVLFNDQLSNGTLSNRRLIDYTDESDKGSYW